MKVLLVTLLALASLACAERVEEIPENPVYGYLTKVAIPRGEAIRKSEARAQRIVGGLPAGLGQYPYQAGLLLSISGVQGTGVCGGSLVSSNRVVTAAHCWFDGINQAWTVTVVLGSVFLFSGGERYASTNVVVHPNWIPFLIRNDIAVIHLPNSVTFSSTISPIALPEGNELGLDFVGYSAIASGFGLTSDGGSISGDQFLSHVRLNVASGAVCSVTSPIFYHSATNICTSGLGSIGPCQGDSGGPLVTEVNGRTILIGVVSYGSALGCQSFMPAVYARATAFVPFILSNL